MSMSRSQIDKLGDRLRKAEVPSNEDLVRYEEMLPQYAPAFELVKHVCADLDLVITTRFPKTAGTLVEKLKRESARLSQVQDIAGVRVLVDGDRSDQDAVVDALKAEFRSAGHEVTVFDRRENPSHGYRAVHVIPVIEGVPVEIQVRTTFQDMWANIMERFADIYGRQVRYGEPPDEPDRLVRPGAPETIGSFHELIISVADAADMLETANQLHEIEPSQVLDLDDLELDELGLDPSEFEALRGQEIGQILETLDGRLQDALRRLHAIVEKLDA